MTSLCCLDEESLLSPASAASQDVLLLVKIVLVMCSGSTSGYRPHTAGFYKPFQSFTVFWEESHDSWGVISVVWCKIIAKLSQTCLYYRFMPPVTHSAFSTNTCTVVASKREAWDAVAASNHGDEAKKNHTVQKEEQRTPWMSLRRFIAFVPRLG